MKPIGYNRNLMGGKRPHRGISKMPKECISNLTLRLRYESKQLTKYFNRLRP